MKRTLLSMVQDILSDMGGDEINSIKDTDESMRVARIIKNVFFALMSNSAWPMSRRAVTLTARSSSDFPTHMVVDDDLKELISVFYNTAQFDDDRILYKEIEYKEPTDFLRKLNNRDSTSSDARVVVDDSGIKLIILTNKAPEFYTSFDDKNIIFDSYDEKVDGSLQESKLQAEGYIMPSFSLEDNFIPEMPADLFSLLLEKSTSAAQSKIREIQDPYAIAETNRQSRWASRKSWAVHGGIKYPNYGRKR